RLFPRARPLAGCVGDGHGGPARAATHLAGHGGLERRAAGRDWPVALAIGGCEPRSVPTRRGGPAGVVSAAMRPRLRTTDGCPWVVPGPMRGTAMAERTTAGPRPAEPGAGAEDATIRRFQVSFPDQDLAELRRRIAATRW